MTTKTFLTVASHWHVPGIRQYASPDRAGAERKAAELTEELRAEFERDLDDFDRKLGAEAPPPTPVGYDWLTTLRALQLARLIQATGGEGEANDVLFSFCERTCAGEPPLIGEGFPPALQEIIGDFVEEDSSDPDCIGFPNVWIEEVDAAEAAARTEAPSDSALVLAIQEQITAWQARQAPAGQEMNDDRDQEEADTVVDVLQGILRDAKAVQPRIAVVCSGGCMQAVVGDAAIDVMLVDYDVDLGDGPYPMLEQDAGVAKAANVWIETAEVEPQWLDMVEEAVKREERDS